MSKKDKKQFQCYMCKFPIKGVHNIVGWLKMKWVAHPDWPEEWVPICGDCSGKCTVERVNELYDGDDEVNYWRHKGMGA